MNNDRVGLLMELTGQQENKQSRNIPTRSSIFCFFLVLASLDIPEFSVAPLRPEIFQYLKSGLVGWDGHLNHGRVKEPNYREIGTFGVEGQKFPTHHLTVRV
jgi:hypothetical protein